jgi:hypothetical protein
MCIDLRVSDDVFEKGNQKNARPLKNLLTTTTNGIKKNIAQMGAV